MIAVVSQFEILEKALLQEFVKSQILRTTGTTRKQRLRKTECDLQIAKSLSLGMAGLDSVGHFLPSRPSIFICLSGMAKTS